MDRGQSTILLSLDLSATFDTIDHGTLNRLQISFSITGYAHDWIRSYLSNREQFVRIGKSCSTQSICHTGVPQGLILRPILFSLYISPISSIVNHNGITQQQYADDTQLFITVSNLDYTREIQHLEAYLQPYTPSSAQTIWR